MARSHCCFGSSDFRSRGDALHQEETTTTGDAGILTLMLDALVMSLLHCSTLDLLVEPQACVTAFAPVRHVKLWNRLMMDDMGRHRLTESVP